LQYLKELGGWYSGRDENPISQQQKRNRIEEDKHVKNRYEEMRAAAAVVANVYWKRVWTVQEYSSPQAGLFHERRRMDGPSHHARQLDYVRTGSPSIAIGHGEARSRCKLRRLGRHCCRKPAI